MKKFTTILLMTLTLSFCLSGCGNSSELEALKTTASEKDAIIAERDVEIADLNNQITELNTTIADLQAQLDELTKKVAEQETEFTNEDKIDVVGPLGPGYKYEETVPHPEVQSDGSTKMVYGSMERPVTSCPHLKPGEMAYFYVSGQIVRMHGTPEWAK